MHLVQQFNMVIECKTYPEMAPPSELFRKFIGFGMGSLPLEAAHHRPQTAFVCSRKLLILSQCSLAFLLIIQAG